MSGMTLGQAVEELKKFNKGKYSAIDVQVTIQEDGRLRFGCKCYVSDYHWTEPVGTFEDALYQMAQQMNQVDHPERVEAILNTTIPEEGDETDADEKMDF